MIEDFIDRLSQCNIFPDVENQYSPSFAYSSITRNNLTTYLKVMNQLKPTIMLIGEAPGYMDVDGVEYLLLQKKIL